jgi:hypothetical protein
LCGDFIDIAAAMLSRIALGPNPLRRALGPGSGFYAATLAELFLRTLQDADVGAKFQCYSSDNLNFPIAASGTVISAETFSGQANDMAKAMGQILQFRRKNAFLHEERMMPNPNF